MTINKGGVSNDAGVKGYIEDLPEPFRHALKEIDDKMTFAIDAAQKAEQAAKVGKRAADAASKASNKAAKRAQEAVEEFQKAAEAAAKRAEVAGAAASEAAVEAFEKVADEAVTQVQQKTRNIQANEALLLQRIESLENKLKILEGFITKEHNLPSLIEENENLEILLKVTAKIDPVLAEIWDNQKDAAYDHV